MRIKTETITSPVRRVTLELPVERANALARAIDQNITWSHTDVEDELAELYDALEREE